MNDSVKLDVYISALISRSFLRLSLYKH